MNPDIQLELVDSKHPLWPVYKDIRSRHYVLDGGSIGRQLRYLIRHKNIVSGIISGASSAFSVKARDEFFGLNLCEAFDHSFGLAEDEIEPIKYPLLGTIINNTVFRLENHEPNLATQVLALWRRQVIADWEGKYDDRLGSCAHPLPVLGFETYVVEHEHSPGHTRMGSCYKADNWTLVGRTDTNKLIYCKRNPKFLDSLLNDGECLVDWCTVELLKEMYRCGE
jgi:hypothetical protein